MSVENGEWIMRGLAWDDPYRIRTWRELIARSREVAYGKFFGKKAGFISLEWLPYFANARRDGYDFDSLYEEGLANARSKRIMDVFSDVAGAVPRRADLEAGRGTAGGGRRRRRGEIAAGGRHYGAAQRTGLTIRRGVPGGRPR